MSQSNGIMSVGQSDRLRMNEHCRDGARPKVPIEDRGNVGSCSTRWLEQSDPLVSDPVSITACCASDRQTGSATSQRTTSALTPMLLEELTMVTHGRCSAGNDAVAGYG